MFTRGDPDVEENVISDDKNEPLGMPEDMVDVQGGGGYLNRAYSNSEPQAGTCNFST